MTAPSHHIRRLTLFAAVALLLAGCAKDTLVAYEEEKSVPPAVPLAQKSHAQSVEGDFTVTSAVPLSVEPDDHACVIELRATFRFEGALDGAFTADFRIEHDGPCDQPAQETFAVHGTFVGLVAGIEGSYPFEFEGTIDTGGNASGKLEMASGNVEAILQLEGTAGVAGTYTGTVNVDA